jgi:FPC/CPF motif-containing protein YcgG
MERFDNDSLDNGAETGNPFTATGGIASNYCRDDGRRLTRGFTDQPASALTTFVHDSVLALIRNPRFTCVGARSAVNRRTYRFALYSTLGGPDSAAGLAHDLYTFVREAATIDADFATFIASFEGPVVADELAFERLLWAALQQLHTLDVAYHPWAPGVCADPDDPAFSFSFAETALFVVGLHAASSRVARRLAWPTLVFNPRRQFDRLKRDGRYSRMRAVIRDADRRLQGTINPMSADFGERSEAAQYSGRHVEADWQCPFAPRRRDI